MMFWHRKHSDKEPELFWHTDVHSHVCPGIDDGARDGSHSVRLVEAMGRMGFARMVVTPHVTDDVFPNTPEIIHHSYQRLREQCARVGLEMKFHCSAEYRIGEMLAEELEQGVVSPLPGGYLLVENSWLQEPPGLEGFLFEVRNRYGLIPVLAHPERYTYYHRKRRRYEELHDKGILFQVNLLSLAGHYDKQCKATAEWLLERRFVEFIGSDLHRSAHIDSIRSYLCSKDYHKLEAAAPFILNDSLNF